MLVFLHVLIAKWILSSHAVLEGKVARMSVMSSDCLYTQRVIVNMGSAEINHLVAHISRQSVVVDCWSSAGRGNWRYTLLGDWWPSDFSQPRCVSVWGCLQSLQHITSQKRGALCEFLHKWEIVIKWLGLSGSKYSHFMASKDIIIAVSVYSISIVQSSLQPISVLARLHKKHSVLIPTGSTVPVLHRKGQPCQHLKRQMSRAALGSVWTGFNEV